MHFIKITLAANCRSWLPFPRIPYLRVIVKIAMIPSHVIVFRAFRVNSVKRNYLSSTSARSLFHLCNTSTPLPPLRLPTMPLQLSSLITIIKQISASGNGIRQIFSVYFPSHGDDVQEFQECEIVSYQGNGVLNPGQCYVIDGKMVWNPI